MQEWSKEKESVAHHEVGHWVIAHLSGSLPGDVGLGWDESEKCWQGFSHRKPKADPREAIRIAFAGPWAEILFQARKKHPHATFDVADEPSVLISQVQNADDEECDNNNGMPVVALLLPSGASEPFSVDPNAFSFDDCMASQLAQGDKNLIRELLFETRNEMNDSARWSAIERLANELLNRLGDGRKVVIAAEDAQQVVEQATR